MNTIVNESETGRGRVAVVTGAGTGIGRVVTRALLDAGFRVGLAGRHEDALLESAADHPNALVVPTDIVDPRDVQRLFDTVVERWGRVDVLFNNAGAFGPVAMVDEISLDDWNSVVGVNLTGTMLCSAAAVRQMKVQTPQGGRIINNGSISAHSPRPLSVAYATTKHGITGLTKSIALDGRPFGISASQIDIGNAATDRTARFDVGTLQADGSSKVEPRFPVEEVARAVLLIAQLPIEATIDSLIITAAGMPFVGRG